MTKILDGQEGGDSVKRSRDINQNKKIQWASYAYFISSPTFVATSDLMPPSEPGISNRGRH